MKWLKKKVNTTGECVLVVNKCCRIEENCPSVTFLSNYKSDWLLELKLEAACYKANHLMRNFSKLIHIIQPGQKWNELTLAGEGQDFFIITNMIKTEERTTWRIELQCVGFYFSFKQWVQKSQPLDKVVQSCICQWRMWNLPEQPPLSSDHLTKIPIGSSISQIAISETCRRRQPNQNPDWFLHQSNCY